MEVIFLDRQKYIDIIHVGARIRIQARELCRDSTAYKYAQLDNY